jgi:hypothetical protein
MSLSIKVSQLTVLPQITVDDYIIVNDSGSVTTERATIKTLQDFLSGSNEYVGSASFALSSSHAENSNSSSYALSASLAQSASYALSSSYTLSSSYSNSGSYSDHALVADSVSGGSGFATNATSSSYASSSFSSSYSLSASYARSASYSLSSSLARSSSYSISSSLADISKGVNINGGIFMPNVLGNNIFNNPIDQWITMWSGSNTPKLQRSAINDLGVQYNVGKPLTFQIVNETTSTDNDIGLTPLKQPYVELRQGFGAHGPWLIMSYLYSGGTGNDSTGSWPGYTDPNILPPGTNGIDRNLRIIPKTTIPNNTLDETGFGSQAFTLYSRASRNFAWYQGGSFFGHNDAELSPGISGSCVMVLAGSRLGIGQFGSGSHADPSTNLHPPVYPQAPLHISASEGAMNDTNTPLVRLDQKVGTAGTIGSLQGWIRVSINGVAYKMPLYN